MDYTASYADRQYFGRNPGVSVRERDSFPDEIQEFLAAGHGSPMAGERIYRTTVTQQGKGRRRRLVVHEYVLCASGAA